MKYRHFPPLQRELSSLVLGTTVYRSAGVNASTELLDAWLELGGNVVDCGREYGDSERVLGRWLHERGCREQIVVLTKGAHEDAVRQRVTPADIRADLEESLHVLDLDSVDIYLLHRDDPSQPVGPLVEALNEHRAAGRIHAFGASNWTPARIEEANEYAAGHGLEGFSCSSPGLSLARQCEPPWPGCVSADDADSLEWYERTGLPLFPWSAQAGGFFAGADGPFVLRVYGSEDNVERLRRAAHLAAAPGRTANEVALAWVLAQPFPSYPIIGPRTVDELLASVAALDLELTPAERAWLNLEADDLSAHAPHSVAAAL